MTDIINTISISAKWSDMFSLSTDSGFEMDGYVPRGLGFGGGDYVELRIDNSTGRILNWRPIVMADIDGSGDADEASE